MKRCLTRVMVLASALLCAASAQSVTVSPTAYNINPETSNTAQVRLENTSEVPVKFRVEVMRWWTENGQYLYSPTREVVVNPPELTLAPHASQVIRVGVLKKAGANELTYRVFVRQQPIAATPSATTGSADVQVRVQTMNTLTLPVYITPSGSTAKVTSQIKPNGAGVLELRLSNAGNRHLTLRQVRVQAGTQTVALGSVAVLGSSLLLFALPELDTAASSLTLIYNDANGNEQREQLPVVR